VQNPGTRVAPNLLIDRFSGGRVLDLCSAPGGKALYLEKKLGAQVQEIVALDLAGPRFDRMVSNFSRYGSKTIRALAGSLLELKVEDTGKFEALLLDAPCSNSGVLQHKVDARWRMDPKGFGELLKLQRSFLEAAAALVVDGGVLVYSTCSIDRDENEMMVETFLDSESGASFVLEASTVSLPWREQHDGSGAFVLRKR
jgi:16S rRNA (cytosine967-C5)-methyltransferase